MGWNKRDALLRVISFMVMFSFLVGCSSQVIKDGVPVVDAAPQEFDNADEALKLAHILRDNGRYKAAYEVYKSMDDKGFLKGAYVLEYASLSASVLTANETISLYQRAQQALPEKQTSEQQQAICVGLARAYLELAELDQAEAYFQCALQQNANSVVALNGLGVIANMQGDVSLALFYLKTAQKLSPSSQLINNNLALIWLSDGQYQKAISLLKSRGQSITITERLNLALAYVYEQREDMAREVLLEVIPKNNTEKILDRYSASQKRIVNGASLTSEIVALTNSPVQLKSSEE